MDIKDKIKCGTYTVGFDDVPNHVSLILSITNCTGTCEGCHLSWLRDDVGEVLEDNIIPIVNRYKDYINCICFMGEGNQLQENNLIKCFNIIKEYFPNWKSPFLVVKIKLMKNLNNIWISIKLDRIFHNSVH